MKGSLFWAELKGIVKNPKSLIQVSAIVLIPILYAGMFIWAFWDPYGSLEKLPVAVVNEDQGATMEGKKLEIGNELVENLKDEKNLDFHFVNRNKAYDGLDNQKYYMIIEIPKEFSNNATTLMEDNPKALQLKYVENETANYTSSKINDSAMEKIKTAVSKEVTATFSEEIFNVMKDMADGYADASDGANQLNDGAVQINDGSQKLKDNLEKLASKSLEFNQGVKDAHAGTDDLEKGATEIKNGLATLDSKLPELVDGTNQAQKGAEKIKEQLPTAIASQFNQQLTDSVGKLDTGIESFESQLGAQLAAQIAEQTISQQTAKMQELSKVLVANGVSPDLVKQIMEQQEKNSPTKEQLQQQINQELNPALNKGFTQFKTGLSEQLLGATSGLEDQIKGQTDPIFNELIDGIGTINSNQKKLSDGVHSLYVGSTELSKGTQQLSSGMNQLSSGSGQLSNGAGQLADGSKDLANGSEELTDGTKELKDKLGDAAKDTSDIHADKNTYDMMGEPVVLDKDSINKVPNYGTGLTPYFLSLGLFVGALLLTIVYQLRETALTPRNGFSWFLGKYGVMAVVGILQSLIAVWILIGWVGIEVQSIPLFVLTAVITSLTFMALIQLFVTVLDNPGRYLAVIILILQLTSSAGTFPLELLPNALKPIHQALPMTYSLQAFKASISSGDTHALWHNIGILLIYMFSFIILSVIYFVIKKKKNERRLQTNEESAM